MTNPVAMNVFSTISMTMLAISIGCLRIDAVLSAAVWWIATPFQSLLAVLIASQWVMQPRSLQELVPHMFLPVVGLALVPISGVALGFRTIGALYWGTSFVFWVLLFTQLMQRLFFLGVLPPKMVPSMFISVAPPCLVGLAYVELNPGADNELLPWALYGVALFFVALMTVIRARLVSIPLSTSWWAYVFPMANFASFTNWFHLSVSTSYAPVREARSAVVVALSANNGRAPRATRRRSSWSSWLWW